MTQKRRYQLLVGALAILVAIAALRALGGRPGEGRQGGALAVFRTSEPVSQTELAPLAMVRIADLDKKPGDYSPGRDPFRFAAAQKPPPPPPRATPKPPPRPTPRPANRPTTPAKPRPPAIDVKFLGSFGPEKAKIAVFTDGNDIFNARKGDVVKEHFRVDGIGFESADLGFVNFPDEPAKRLAAGG